MYVKLRPYRLRSLAKRQNEKLGPKYFGPFEIIKRVGPVAYHLRLPPAAAIYPVFHVSQLRKALGTNTESPLLPHHLTENLEWVEPEQVLGVRSSATGQASSKEVLIQ